MRILVVDDEYYSRKAIMQMIGDCCPHAALDEAEDGGEALGMLRSNRYDLLFSDIRMPGLDGIQLAAAVHEQFPSLVNVIVSGYDDFQYAQKAIAYRVEQYLLKPVQMQQIAQIMQRIQQQAELSAQRCLEERLAAVIYQEPDGGEEAETEFPLAGRSYRTAVFQMDRPYKERLEQALNEQLRHAGAACCFFCDRRNGTMHVAVLHAPGGFPWERLRLKELCMAAMEPIKRAGARIYAGLSSVIKDNAGGTDHGNELRQSYRQAKRALLNRHLAGGGSVGLYEELSGNPRYSFELLEELLLPLYNKLIRYQDKEAAELIGNLFRVIAERRLSAHTLHDTCSKLIAIFNAVIERINEEGAGTEPEPYLAPVDLYDYYEPDEIVRYLNGQAAALSAKLQQVRSRTDIVQQMKDYVERNYRHQILLDDMAKTMFYTDTSYLSRLFKKKSGMSFTNYLLSVRMQNAKKLLETDLSLSVADVASAVGFNDYSYFIHMYKKFYGETPGQSKKRD
ncbi:response regulator [Paenibacillus piri]|uniref:Response regulator n=1 Tax=Paenibacillus piri TaxID=2547395 RepID=A0A4R5KY78_9BACL|nr:response regulator [Paenibacillus piri]TDG00797.1 response regulator [Paenibacillus piri]